MVNAVRFLVRTCVISFALIRPSTDSPIRYVGKKLILFVLARKYVIASISAEASKTWKMTLRIDAKEIMRLTADVVALIPYDTASKYASAV